MQFLNPQGFFALLTALPIIALYLMRLHYMDTNVPSLLLWQAVVRDMQANRPWQKLRKHWLLFLQLLIVLCLALSLAKPVIPARLPVPEQVFVLVDLSASMTASAPAGTTVDASRFTRAMASLERALASYPESAITLVGVSDSPKVIHYQADSERLSRELPQLTPTDGRADWSAATRLLQGLSEDIPEEVVTTLVVSDFAFSADTPSWADLLPGRLMVIDVGDQQPNVGIVTFTARREDAGVTVFARIQNAGAATERTVDIFADGILVDRQTLTLPGESSLELTFEAIAAQTTLELRIDEPDAFLLDNAAWIALDEQGKTSTLLVTAGNRFLTHALSNLPSNLVRQTTEVTGTRLYEEVDVLVLDTSAIPGLPEMNQWLIAPAVDTVCGMPGEFVEVDAPVQGEWQHPVLQYVDWTDVYLAQARRYQLPATANVLLSIPGVPLLYTLEKDGYRVVCSAFRLQDGDLALRLAFPILVSNIMEWLAPRQSTEVQRPLRPGERWMPRLPANATSVTLADPKGMAHELSMESTGFPLNHIGLYRARITTPAGQDVVHAAVTLQDSQESDIRSRYTVLSTMESALAVLGQGQRDIGLFFIILAVVLCCLEAYFWWGRSLRRNLLQPYLKRAGTMFALMLRAVVLLSLVVLLLDFRLPQRVPGIDVVMVIDRSDSTRHLWEAQTAFLQRLLAMKSPEDEVAVVVFGRQAWVERALSSGDAVPAVRTLTDRSGTHIEAAVRLATALLPAQSAGRLILCSDGLETTGTAQHAVDDALAQGIDVQILDAPASSPYPELWVDSVRLPTQITPGDQVPIQVAFRTNAAQTVHLRWSLGSEVASATVDVLATAQPFAYQFLVKVEEPGFYPLRICVEPEKDTYRENNCSDQVLAVHGEPTVLVIGTEQDTSAVLQALEATGVAAERMPPGESPPSLTGLAAYSALIVVNVPARDLPSATMEAIPAYVRDIGGGLISIGGPTSFGVGGWMDTPLEAALPLDMRVQDPQRFPPMAVVLVMDTSGSMANEETGTPKIRLAAEAALRAADSLNAGDILAVIGYSDSMDFSTGPVTVGGPHNLQQALSRLSAEGGGLFVFESLTAAVNLLSTLTLEDSVQRHIILLADGADAEHQEGAAGLVKDIQDMGISTSVISIGRGEDTVFLSSLAEAGQGRFYLAASAANLPAIFTEEVARAKRSLIVETPFTPQSSAAWASLSEITAYPQLLGYVAAAPKDRADILVRANPLDPLLAVWQYGLGRSAAFTSDATARWAINWISWEGFAQFWGAVVRDVLRTESDADVKLDITYAPEHTHVAVDIAGETSSALNLQLTFSAAGGSGENITTPLLPSAPGRYEADIADLTPGPYLIRLSGDRNDVIGWAPPPAKEYLPGDASAALARLAAQTGARLIATPEDVFATTLPSKLQSQSLAVPLTLLALVVWVFDIAWRRLDLSWRALLAPLQSNLARVTSRLLKRRHRTVRSAGWVHDMQSREEKSGSSAVTVRGTKAQEVGEPPSLSAKLRARLRDGTRIPGGAPEGGAPEGAGQNEEVK